MIENKDNNEKIIHAPGFEEKNITAKDRLTFGKSIICGAALIFVASMIVDIIWPSSPIFDACKTILPPLVTLIIGYYFGEHK